MSDETHDTDCIHLGSPRTCCGADALRICRLHKPQDCIETVQMFLHTRAGIPPAHHHEFDTRIRCCETCTDKDGGQEGLN